MFGDRWKKPEPPGGRVSSAPPAARAGSPAAPAVSRRSNGLEQFFGQLRGESGLNLLDLSGASQANIGFITNLGHRIYSDDFVATLDIAFGDGDFYQNQADPQRQERFLAQNLPFGPNQFDGALLWDALEFLSPPLLKCFMDRLRSSIKPGSYIFALFHAEERSETINVYQYRIADAGNLLLLPRGSRKPAQLFSNRAVEKLFHGFDNVKFFLTRDNLREVIVRR